MSDLKNLALFALLSAVDIQPIIFHLKILASQSARARVYDGGMSQSMHNILKYSVLLACSVPSDMLRSNGAYSYVLTIGSSFLAYKKISIKGM